MAGLDPLTARAGLQTAREVISSKQIRYPVPYILAILLVFCLACLLIKVFTEEHASRVVVLALACSAFLLGAAILVYAIVFDKLLLRSERHEQVMRLIEIAGDRRRLRTFVTESPRRCALWRNPKNGVEIFSMRR
jgi:hypothetical protein